MLAVAVSSEANLSKLAENRARLAKLADPRTIGLNDAEADKLVDQSVPVTTSPAPSTRPKRGRRPHSWSWSIGWPSTKARISRKSGTG